MSGELAGCMFIYTCSLHWLEGVEWGRLQRKGEGGCKNKCVPMMYLKELFIERFCGTRKYKRAYLVPGDKT